MDSSAIQFGMMNSMRTSNVILDTLICLLIPIVFKCFFDSSEQLTVAFAYVRDCFRRKGNEVVRRIELKTHFNTWGKVQDTEEHNHILQKAISIYLSDHLVMAKKSGRYELLDKVDSPETDATELAEPEPEDDPYGLNESLELQKLKIGALPPLNEWITIEPELEFYHEISSNDGHNGGGGGENNALKESTITFILRSTAVDATDRIDAFVNRAFESYQAAVVAKHKKDKTRYMYMTAATAGSSGAGDGGGGGDAGASVAKYKRYGLSEDKTFDSLFFDDKPKLLTLLDNFQTKRGKFGIRGFPYKMGLLLHGPPGTGKTSLIKAVAQHTNRHIVNISLSKIKTNQELMDMMFDLKFGLDGEDLPVKLRFDQIVFVMEDVDCASNVVLARTDATSTSLSQRDTTSITRGGTATTSPPPHVQCNGDDDDLIGIGECGFEGGDSPRHRRQPRDEEGGGELDPLVDMVIGPKNYSTNRLSSWGPKDKLNLSGLLNVLDGVVDSPGRILILTTNHPEKLDPALIRPGRVNKQVQLGPINGRQTVAMMEHYFACTLSPNQSAVVDRVFERATNSGISPAQIEQLCAEHDDVDDMLEELATLFTT